MKNNFSKTLIEIVFEIYSQWNNKQQLRMRGYTTLGLGLYILCLPFFLNKEKIGIDSVATMLQMVDIWLIILSILFLYACWQFIKLARFSK